MKSFARAMIIGFILMSSVIHAQQAVPLVTTTTPMEWDQEGPSLQSVSAYRYRFVEGTASVIVPASCRVTATAGKFICAIPSVPFSTPGIHAVTLFAGIPNGAGGFVESGPSNVCSYRIDPTAPSAPTNLRVVIGGIIEGIISLMGLKPDGGNQH